MTQPTPAAELVLERTEEAICPPPCGRPFQRRVFPCLGREIRSTPLCPGCRAERERKREGERRELQRDLASRRAATDRQERLEALAVPPLYEHATLATFESHGSPADQETQERVRRIAARYLGSWPLVEMVLVFHGGTGSGKGHLAWSIAKALVETADARVEVVKLPGLIRKLRDTWRTDSGATYDQVLGRYWSLDLLVIDEVSRHAFYGQQIHQHLYDIIDYRVEQLRPTILTSNEDGPGLTEILGPALVSRLEGAGGLIDFGTADYRRRPRD